MFCGREPQIFKFSERFKIWSLGNNKVLLIKVLDKAKKRTTVK